jgi:hypothetical protein
VKRLRRVFNDLPYDLGSKVDVWPGSDNAKAAKEADIILIWYDGQASTFYSVPIATCYIYQSSSYQMLTLSAMVLQLQASTRRLPPR